MKTNLLTRFIILAFIIFFISLPVFSGENPWDADDDDKYDGKIIIDSTTINSIVIIRTGNRTSPDFDWTTNLLSKLSLNIVTWYYNDEIKEPLQLRETRKFKIESKKTVRVRMKIEY